jgi:hypothetical protein
MLWIETQGSGLDSIRHISIQHPYTCSDSGSYTIQEIWDLRSTVKLVDPLHYMDPDDHKKSITGFTCSNLSQDMTVMCLSRSPTILLIVLITQLWGSHLTHSKKQSPSWEDYSTSTSQETHRLLWNPKVHCCVHKSVTTISILNQMYPVHNLPTYFLNIVFNIILLSAPTSSKCFFPSGLPTKIFYASLITSICVTCPAHHTLLVLIILMSGEDYKLWISSLCNFLKPPVTLSLVCQSIILSTMEWNPWR